MRAPGTMSTSGSSGPVSPTVAPYPPSTDYTCDDLRPARSRPGCDRSSVVFLLCSRAQTIRAILLASATVTSIRGLRASICSSHEPLGAPRLLARCTTALLPCRCQRTSLRKSKNTGRAISDHNAEVDDVIIYYNPDCGTSRDQAPTTSTTDL